MDSHDYALRAIWSHDPEILGERPLSDLPALVSDYEGGKGKHSRVRQWLLQSVSDPRATSSVIAYCSMTGIGRYKSQIDRIALGASERSDRIDLRRRGRVSHCGGGHPRF